MFIRGCRPKQRPHLTLTEFWPVRAYLVAAGLLIASRAYDDHGAEVSEDS
jgi:hypothetical protein